MDVMGGVILTDGTELKAITGIDDHSRYCVIAKLVHRATKADLVNIWSRGRRNQTVLV